MDRKFELPSFRSEWTPEEIKGQNFKGSLFGFSRKEVQDFLRALSKLWVRMLEHQQILTDRIVRLESEVASWNAREKEIAEIKARAEADAAKLLAETDQKAEAIRSKTEAWLEEVIAQVEETQRQKTNFLTAFRSALDSHYALIRTEEDDVEPLSAKLTGILRKPSEGRALGDHLQ
jgi:cell division initiation protein